MKSSFFSGLFLATFASMKDFVLGMIFFVTAKTVFVTLGGINNSIFSGTCSTT